MDWGEGRVLAVNEAGEVGGAYCDSCDRSIDHGLVIGVAAKRYGSAAPVNASLCESCYEDLTSDMGVRAAPGSGFLILVEPSFGDRT